MIRVATEYFDSTNQEIQIAFAHEEHRVSQWKQGIASVKNGAGLVEASNLFLLHLRTFPVTRKFNLVSRKNDVKGWVNYYFLKFHKKKEETTNFETVWAQMVGGQNQTVIEAVKEADIGDGVYDINHSHFGFDMKQTFRRVDGVAEVIKGNYVKAEYMLNHLVPGEVIGIVESTATPGVFELVAEVSEEIEDFSEECGLDYMVSLFWVQYYACATKGVTNMTFTQIYTEQVRRLLAKKAQKRMENFVHIPSYLAESDEEEEEEEGEEEEEDDEEAAIIDMDQLEGQLENMYTDFKERRMKMEEEDARLAEEEQRKEVEEERIAFENRDREIFYVKTMPAGFRSLGDTEQLGRGTLDDPFCTLEYTFKHLRTSGYPHCTVCLLDGFYPPLVIDSVRNCDITRESGKVTILGTYSWQPVVRMVNCRNMKIYGLEFSHGTVGVDASKSTDIFIFENVMTDVLSGVVNPKFGELGVAEGTVIDLNLSNYILQSFVPPKVMWPYHLNYLIATLAFITMSLSTSYIFVHTLDMSNAEILHYSLSCYVAVLFDAVTLQPIYYYILTQRERCCSNEVWKARLETGKQPGYPITEDISSGSDIE